MGEECLGVFSGTTSYGTLWRQCAVAEILDILRVNQRTDIFHVNFLNFVVLVRSTETIKEVDERNRCLKCGKVRNCRKVHNLLYRTRAEHGKASLTAGHNILVVAEDTE